MKQYTQETIEKFKSALASARAKEAFFVDGKVPVGEGEFEVIATTQGLDRDGEVISVSGWDIKNYLKNPVILFGHDYWSMPVGAAIEVRMEQDRMIIRGVFANTQRGQELRRLYDDGILRTVSVGFIPKTRNGNVITEAELLELSFVPVPSNPEALSLAKMNQILTVLKSAGPAFAPKETEWNATEAEKRVKEWVEAGNELSVDAGIVDIVDGAPAIVWRGVEEAMIKLLSDQKEDVKEAYEALKAYYEQFGEEAPELKSYTQYELDQLVQGEAKKASLEEDVKAIKDFLFGQNVDPAVLSSESRALVKLTMDHLAKVYELSEPTGEEASLKVAEQLKALQSVDKIVENAIVALKAAR